MCIPHVVYSSIHWWTRPPFLNSATVNSAALNIDVQISVLVLGFSSSVYIPGSDNFNLLAVWNVRIKQHYFQYSFKL